ncbi:uncharacterized protein JN550_006514 [Neoarthrinium moseri]|uniref:uncharacterized protein n=1 Tax=Neoarthrinium moseri TaxID=1658444 RepID=UPI001FDB7793|nr:uncharacterized protein JN550_006514 [Neoarthrinium moseri]KAI1868026.1 hypothetical protein JN550_006514 [Neoarthrinium moseri]
MLRLRRYRVYLIITAVALLLLYRMSQDADWEGLPMRIDYGAGAKSKSEAPLSEPLRNTDHLPETLDLQRKRPQGQRPLQDQEKEPEKIKIPDLKEPFVDGDQADYTLPTTTRSKPEPTSVDKLPSEDSATAADAPVVVIPDRKTPHQVWEEQAELEKQEKLRQDGQQKQTTAETKTRATTTTTTTAHWQKPTEIFTIAPESIISLPTGKPKAIPKVQHGFKQETAEARDQREGRLAKVKSEMKRAWDGYRSYAWMHDELSPVTQKFRDPFCGWAATLVDALDTLWIMGMKEEFEEAVQAAAKIDFTTASRMEIPVFETTIRYLGGFLGAYDVSGGHEGGYQILLEKAVELAEILMGVFDTPNRMPILYYGWRPSSTGRPRRAAAGANLAELGSLSMEFTRLAQLTQENKYYDAIARITDALEEWQSRPNGTAIPGIFPESVDATGCNRTAARDAEIRLSEEEAQKVQSVMDTPDDYTGREYSQKSKASAMNKKVSDSSHVGKTGGTGAGKPKSLNSRSAIDDDDEDPQDRPLTVKTGAAAIKQKPTAPEIPSAPDLYQQMMIEKVTAEPYTIAELGTEVCYPQGLTSGGWGRDSFSMGGSQDSTYEYFPKQYLLLGGLESKYRDMHLKVAEAVKKWLLYRPMVPGDRDILFSAKLTTMGNPLEDALTEYEVTHLTCFLGGMFGMAGKIFDDPMDVEIGKKLTDGCVWAYETMPTGIMPEGATVVPCSNAGSCKWNETLWHQYLDPLWNTREVQIEDYYKRKAEKKKEAAEQAALEAKENAALASGGDSTMHQSPAAGETDTKVSKATVERESEVLKRGLGTTPHEELETSSNDNSPPTKTTKKLVLEDSLDFNLAGGTRRVGAPVKKTNAQIPLTDEDEEDPLKPDPHKPLSHEEYIATRIKNEKIPGGFVTINHRHYILRPEAIESVWYMYRITGDTTWQDKGWRMFESIIAATQTEAGHSAVQDVLTPGSSKSNEMESFWLAETLKYFYLLYSTPDVISLDDWVLNTEAHPFKRPTTA